MNLKSEIELATKNMKAGDKLIYASGSLFRESLNLKQNFKEFNKIIDIIIQKSSNGKSGIDEIEVAEQHIEIVQAYTQRVNNILTLAKSYGIEADAENTICGKQLKIDDCE